MSDAPDKYRQVKVTLTAWPSRTVTFEADEFEIREGGHQIFLLVFRDGEQIAIFSRWDWVEYAGEGTEVIDDYNPIPDLEQDYEAKAKTDGTEESTVDEQGE